MALPIPDGPVLCGAWAVNQVAKKVKESVVCSLARAGIADIDRAAEALEPAARKRIHTFIATSPLHMAVKLQMEPEAVHQAVIDSVTHARRFTDDVEWSCEDGSRSEHDFLCRCIESAIDFAGGRFVKFGGEGFPGFRVGCRESVRGFSPGLPRNQLQSPQLTRIHDSTG